MVKNLFHYIANTGLSLAVLIVACSATYGCSKHQLPERPRSIVNKGIYIFVGEVIGYSEPISDPSNFRGTAIGVKLRMLESIHFPYFQNDFVELFMFGHGSDCFPEASDYRPPLGSKYRLALGEARLVANRNLANGGRVRLESNVFSRLAIDETIFGFSTTAESEFDYKKDYRLLADKFTAPEMADKRRWLDDFIYIEASKDLLRLQKATSEKERMDILERLLYCPNINYRRLFSSEVGNPLRTEEGDFLSLVILPRGYVYKSKPRKFSKRENELMNERLRLENSGELKIW